MGLISRVSSRTYRKTKRIKMPRSASYESRSRSRSRSSSPAKDRHGNSRSTELKRRRSKSPLRVERRSGKPNNVIGVFGMSLRTEKEDLRRKFSKYGDIKDIILVWNKEMNRSRGYGFITYYELADAELAVEKMSGQELDGREIRVDFSLTKEGHRNEGNSSSRYRGSNPDGRGQTRRYDDRRRSRSRSRDNSHRRERNRDSDRRDPDLDHRRKDREIEVMVIEEIDRPIEEIEGNLSGKY